MRSAFANPFARNNPNVIDSARTIKQWVREVLDLTDDDVVSVNELACSLPDCPPKETVILVMRPGKEALQVSIHKSILAVVYIDVSAALQK
ncbi:MULTISPECIES: hypothetical protein [unclassified Sinorhizobium]|uniref:hypothetical protein n=1 Tax=unclassified Sinorhizobium TaxID=2613772 RepID=UPI0024C29A07|nr:MULTISPECIES: hypothetical protein [unclassified Sinorhizobium]MDK1376470.1 hypothetical protein [Sinorhizobium sp. 6-70]MDK1480982.1 hypothetical protein [Sinorhizobium sp. 6-117]